MRNATLTHAAFASLALLLFPALGPTQPPPGDAKAPKPPPDEFKVLVAEVREAYKAPLEVDEDVIDELRKQYKNPTPQREEKIFKEIRRLYHTTPEHERAIVAEVRRAYDARSPEQEERLLTEVRRLGRLPVGTVPASLQAEQSARLFRRLDRDESGTLTADELTDALRGQAGRRDLNGDRVIDPAEYAAYYQTELRSVGERVASGEIPIKLPKGATVASLTEPAPEARPAVRAAKLAPNLPRWYAEYDDDADGQVGLYEWRKHGRPSAEFVRMDRNGDCYLTPTELAAFLATPPAEQPAGARTPGR